MKAKYVLQTLVLLLAVFTANAQQGINYKAIIKDDNGDVMAHEWVLIQFTILENGTTNVYQETHSPTTDANGILIVNIGEGNVVSGNFATIDWGSNPHFLKTEIFEDVGFTEMATTEFKAVPYALFAETTQNFEAPLHLTSTTNEVIRGDHSSGNYGYLGDDSYGVYGSSNGSGVFGYSSNWGVYGRNHNNNSGSLGGSDYGALGSYSSNGNHGYLGSENYGVYGYYSNSGNYGYLGSADNGVYGYHSSSGAGVSGFSNSGSGLRGQSISGVGVYGETRSDYGVYGYHSNSGNNGSIGGSDNGVWGYASRGVGVHGYYHNGNFGWVGSVSYAVYGENITGNKGNLGSEEYGVYGENVNGNKGYLASEDYGVYGYNISGKYGMLGHVSAGVYGYGRPLAGMFNGDVTITGDATITGRLVKGSGSFQIDHPLDPANKFLCHSFVESPDMMNIHNGNVILDSAGEAVIELPEWYGALNKDFRYQLTCIGGYANVYISQKIENNQFKIAGGSPGLEVSWQVTGVRKDAYAINNRIEVEKLKEGDQIGKYLHPEAFGLPDSMGITYGKASLVKSSSK
jgi:hypothetical protein